MPVYPQAQFYVQLKVTTIIIGCHQNFSTAYEVNDRAYLLFLTDGRFMKINGHPKTQKESPLNSCTYFSFLLSSQNTECPKKDVYTHG
jgi:hypothetical protein